MKFIPSRLKALPQVGEHNWLIHSLVLDFLTEIASKYASGIMVDVGCGKKPFESIFSPYVSLHIGLDIIKPPNINSLPDVIGSAYSTSIQKASCNVVLCTEVLEHIEEPMNAVKEINRILKKKGIVILTTPFFWHIHEAPRDFYRYSEFGLRYLFDKAGFEIIEMKPLTGFVITFTQLSIYFLRLFQRGRVLGVLGRLFNWVIQHLALKINRYDKSWNFTNMYGLVAQKIRET